MHRQRTQNLQEHHEQEQQVTGAPIDEPPDCTIACDKGHITVHKLVLCEHSKYLQEILSKYPTAEHPIIILTELNIIDVRILVYYMYTGELVITNDASPTSLLRAAQILKIDSLTADDASNSNEYSSSSPTPPNQHDDDNLIFQTERSSNSISHNNSINNSINDLELEAGSSRADPLDLNEDDMDLMEQQASRRGGGAGGGGDGCGSLGSAAGLGADSDPLNDKNNKIRCHLCNIGLSDVKCLYRHVLTRHLPEKWGYKCEFCDREFSRDDHLMRHYTTKHKNMEFNREKIRETRRLNREMAKNFHDQISTA